MLSELLQRVSLFRLLHRIDHDLAEQSRLAGCPYCRGPLHRASYFRKPRGGPDDIPEEYLLRFSLCCGREDCRRRVLPPSCLFMGRKVYWRIVIVVILTLRQRRKNGASINQLQRMFSVSRKTIVRWIEYFRAEFVIGAEWQRLRGLVSATVGNAALPGALLEHYLWHHRSVTGAVVRCLRFLATGQVT